ncbi:hypothetical protein [Chryseobacterium fistulae]|uniref:Uncharacterized protein n=1 Tax=Chryseobacterium fistulae TaxID=2675058 RepID=A0A6N4XQP5_9FLAO|nr:hypothetical protein [Chryseobacterium fistulae]CAA7385929.1 hypothetical protein CHRY9393_00218 [Chryseobacterium fistulae]
MKNIFLSFIVVLAVNISCKKDERATYLTEEASTQQPTPPINNSSKTSLLNQPGMQTSTSSSVSVAPGMNPPHGQPGHRCDIPVGQPLSSKPASANPTQNVTVNGNQTQTIQIDPNTIKPGKLNLDKSGKPIKVAPGMNPPHGELGHRCDIPVGQPLNSKPAQVAQSAQNPHALQPQVAEQSIAMGEKPKLNPAHGQPWHNCAIKVGEALP